MVLFVTPLVKSDRFPIRPAAIFWVPWTIEAAKSDPGRCGKALDPPVLLVETGWEAPDWLE